MRSSQAQRLLSSLLASASSRGPATWGTLVGTGQAAALAKVSPPAAATACTVCSRSLSTQRPLGAASAWPAQLAGFGSRGSAAVASGLPHWGGAASAGSRGLQTSAFLRQEFISLNNLQDNEGARRWVSPKPSQAPLRWAWPDS